MTRRAAPEIPGNRWDLLGGVWPRRPPAVTVVVVHHEQPRALARTLAALRAQTHPQSLMQTIVVDDGSRRPPAVGRGVRLLCQEDRGARAGEARNRGWREATGEVVCFLDADTAPEPEYVRRLTRLPALVSEAVTVGRRRHADFDRLGARALPSDGERAELVEPRWLSDGYRASRNLLDADDRSYRFVISSVMACGRDFFADTGPFADFDAYGGEDWEWAHRAWRNGALLAHVPDAVAWHDGPEWAQRGDEASRRRVKNAETLRLSRLIGAAGSRGRALAPARAEIVARLHGEPTTAAAFVCLDSLLEALPRAVALAAPGIAAAIADPRVRPLARADDGALRWPRLRLDLARACELDATGLRDACERAAGQDPVGLALRDGDGPLVTIREARAAARCRRRGRDLELEARAATGCAIALEPEPDLEAWVGGWGRSRFAHPPGR